MLVYGTFSIMHIHGNAFGLESALEDYCGRMQSNHLWTQYCFHMDYLDVALIKMLAFSSSLANHCSVQPWNIVVLLFYCGFKLLGLFCWTVAPWSTMNQIINYHSSVHDPLENIKLYSGARLVMMASEWVPCSQIRWKYQSNTIFSFVRQVLKVLQHVMLMDTMCQRLPVCLGVKDQLLKVMSTKIISWITRKSEKTHLRMTFLESIYVQNRNKSISGCPEVGDDLISLSFKVCSVLLTMQRWVQ